VHTLLGAVGLAIYIVCVIALAAAVTAVVVRLSPTRSSAPRPPR
jgi:hypothetical protein